MKKILLGSAIAAALLFNGPSFAYYDTHDYPEFVEIQSNQSAFAIPLIGANKSSQAQYGSKNYLDENKVATKRFQIQHILIRNPGWAADYYVPAIKLILVDRTPQMREWMDSTTKGTSAKQQGFKMQSKEGIDIGTGITLSAMVTEENAALFLYTFGTVNDKIDPNNASSNFPSVSYGKSLSEITDTVVRGYVEASLEKEFMKHSFADDNEHAGEYIETIEKDVKAHFLTEGITIDYMGFAGTLEFAEDIQKAINDVFIGTEMALRSQAMMPTLPYQQAQAEIDITKSKAIALTKWNGSLPALPNWIIGSEWIDRFLGYLGTAIIHNSGPTVDVVQSKPNK
jgi:hypothetical protein